MEVVLVMLNKTTSTTGISTSSNVAQQDSISWK